MSLRTQLVSGDPDGVVIRLDFSRCALTPFG